MIVGLVLLWSFVSLWAPVVLLPDSVGTGTLVLVTSSLWLLGLVVLAIFFSDEVRDP